VLGPGALVRLGEVRHLDIPPVDATPRTISGISQKEKPISVQESAIVTGAGRPARTLTVVQQARFHGYHGIAVLGFSAVHTQPAKPPGQRARPHRGQPVVVLPRRRRRRVLPDVARLRRLRRGRSAVGVGDLPAGCAGLHSYSRGDRIRGGRGHPVPVLVAMGERDVLVAPRDEQRAYRSATSIDWYVCPRMAQMHNFAGTRELLWQRIHSWGAWVSAATVEARRLQGRDGRPAPASADLAFSP